MCFRPAAVSAKVKCPECGVENDASALACVGCGAKAAPGMPTVPGAPGAPAVPSAPGMPPMPKAPGQN